MRRSRVWVSQLAVLLCLLICLVVWRWYTARGVRADVQEVAAQLAANREAMTRKAQSLPEPGAPDAAWAEVYALIERHAELVRRAGEVLRQAERVRLAADETEPLTRALERSKNDEKALLDATLREK